MCMHSARCSATRSLVSARRARAGPRSADGPARTRTVNTATSHDALALRRDRGDTLGRTPRSRSAAALPDRYRRRRPATRPAALRLALTDDPITEMAQRLGGRDAAARRMSTLEARATAHRFASRNERELAGTEISPRRRRSGYSRPARSQRIGGGVHGAPALAAARLRPSEDATLSDLTPSTLGYTVAPSRRHCTSPAPLRFRRDALNRV